MKLNDTARFSRRFSVDDILLSGRAHQDASATLPVPVALIGGMFSALLGTKLPGPGTNYLKQDLTFESEAVAEENVTATITVTRIRRTKRLADIRTDCHGEDGRLICTGRALVKYP